MKVRVWKIVRAILRTALVSVLSAAAFLVLAAPVEYVKICTLYGDGFYYIPGTDICFNDTLHDARQQTAYGTWEWREPVNPGTLVPRPNAVCRGGQLVKVGDFSSSDLSPFGDTGRFETKASPLKLKSKQYIKSVIFKGGFTGTGVDPGNFCLFYTDSSHASSGAVSGSPLGCINTSALADLPAAFAFSPEMPTPPASLTEPLLVGANGERWGVISPSDITGELKVWLCIK